jgi:hypothetical protein
MLSILFSGWKEKIWRQFYKMNDEKQETKDTTNDTASPTTNITAKNMNSK